jgi:hypothetical protein
MTPADFAAANESAANRSIGGGCGSDRWSISWLMDPLFLLKLFLQFLFQFGDSGLGENDTVLVIA